MMRVRDERNGYKKVSRETIITAFTKLTERIPSIAIRQGVTSEELARELGVDAGTAREYLWGLVHTGVCDYEENILNRHAGSSFLIFKRKRAHGMG